MPKIRIDDHGRECNGCGVYKTWDNYSKFKQSSTGKKARCRDCCKKYQAGSAELRDVECKMHPLMKAFLIERIHLKTEAA